MVKKIAWSILAQERYKKILEFLIQQWSLQDAENFQKNTEEKLYLIARFPHLGTVTKNNNLFRQFILTKHNKLVYHVQEDKILIVEIIDTRQKEIE